MALRFMGPSGNIEGLISRFFAKKISHASSTRLS